MLLVKRVIEMQAVNQCIGRVVRHRGDWAAILLLDARWASTAAAGKGLRGKLPGWIQNSLAVSESFGDSYARLTRFCRAQTHANGV